MSLSVASTGDRNKALAGPRMRAVDASALAGKEGPPLFNWWHTPSEGEVLGAKNCQ